MKILAARFGATIDFEEPLLDAEHEVGIVRDARENGFRLERRVREVRFSYPEGADVDVALAALVDAWNATGGPGAPYVVERYGEVRRLIPTTAKQPDGTRRPYISPLTCRIALPAVSGFPEERAAEVLRAVESTCGTPPIELAPYQISAYVPPIELPPPPPPPGPSASREEFLAYHFRPLVPDEPISWWTFPAFEGTARDALDDLSRICGGGGYLLQQAPLHHPDVSHRYFLGFRSVDPPRDERGLNRTPLTGPARTDYDPPAFPDPPISWATYRAWWNTEHPDQPATATFGERSAP